MGSAVNGQDMQDKRDEMRRKIGSDIVFTSGEAAALTRQLIEERQDSETVGIRFGTSAVDDYMIPMLPGDLVMVCGRPQNYKTGLMQTLLHSTVDNIMREERDFDECGVMVTWEVSAEQAMAYWLAIESGISATDMMRGNLSVKQWDDLEMAIVKQSQRPLYIVGHSSKRSKDNKRSRPNLTPENVDVALNYIMNDLGLEPRMIILDYLQRIQKPNQRIKSNEHYSNCVDWAKDLALWAGCPAVLGTQARRDVDDRKIRIPTLRDSQWTSNAEQSADKFLSLWMPKTAGNIGNKINIGDLNIEVTEELLLMAVAKQKFGPAGKIFPLYVEPEYLKMGDMELATSGRTPDPVPVPF